MAIHFQNDWEPFLQEEFQKEYYLRLRQFLISEYKKGPVYPDMYDLFNAFHNTSYSGTKVCIIGQDPYHGAGQAHGLCFSVKPGVEIPPSLRNIYQELQNDLGYPIPHHGCLTKWTTEGVLMLNAVLSVRGRQPTSHKNMGWEQFTDRVIELLNLREDPVVFILWGAFARSKAAMITNPQHFIIESPHPSPLSASRGFFGSRPFSRTNAFLKSIGKEPIDWGIPVEI